MFVNTKITHSSDSPKKQWSNLKMLMPSKKGPQSSLNINITDENNQPLHGEDMANYANTYFVTVGSQLADNIVTGNTHYLHEIETKEQKMDNCR